MDIPYATRSKFLDVCEATIRSGRANLDAGSSLQIDVGEGGYVGRTLVQIRPIDPVNFGTDWERDDPTRFPARIKAAATALQRCNCAGSFEISHSDGRIEIRRV